MQLVTEKEIKNFYSGQETAAGYTAGRFKSELHRLLHDRRVAAVQRIFNQRKPRWAIDITPGRGRLTCQIQPPGQLLCVEFNHGMIGQGR